MNSAGLSLIQLEKCALVSTVTLDDPSLGAANPWAVGWTGDGQHLLVTHAGTHELSVIDFRKLMAKISRPLAPLPEDMDFMTGLRQRIKMRGQGPRAMVLSGTRVFIANYFGDTIGQIELSGAIAQTTIPLGESGPLGQQREGGRLFHDATLGYQSWQSCATCP
jgi:hypothetical protein